MSTFVAEMQQEPGLTRPDTAPGPWNVFGGPAEGIQFTPGNMFGINSLENPRPDSDWQGHTDEATEAILHGCNEHDLMLEESAHMDADISMAANPEQHTSWSVNSNEVDLASSPQNFQGAKAPTACDPTTLALIHDPIFPGNEAEVLGDMEIGGAILPMEVEVAATLEDCPLSVPNSDGSNYEGFSPLNKAVAAYNQRKDCAVSHAQVNNRNRPTACAALNLAQLVPDSELGSNLQSTKAQAPEQVYAVGMISEGIEKIKVSDPLPNPGVVTGLGNSFVASAAHEKCGGLSRPTPPSLNIGNTQAEQPMDSFPFELMNQAGDALGLSASIPTPTGCCTGHKEKHAASAKKKRAAPAKKKQAVKAKKRVLAGSSAVFKRPSVFKPPSTQDKGITSFLTDDDFVNRIVASGLHFDGLSLQETASNPEADFEEQRRLRLKSSKAVMARATASVAARGAEGQERAWICEECDARFNIKGHLSQHWRYVHEKFRPHHCLEKGCDAKFGTRFARSQHGWTVHEKRKPFECQYNTCGSVFGQRSHLNRHHKAHLLRPYLSIRRRRVRNGRNGAAPGIAKAKSCAAAGSGSHIPKAVAGSVARLVAMHKFGP